MPGPCVSVLHLAAVQGAGTGSPLLCTPAQGVGTGSPPLCTAAQGGHGLLCSPHWMAQTEVCVPPATLGRGPPLHSPAWGSSGRPLVRGPLPCHSAGQRSAGGRCPPPPPSHSGCRCSPQPWVPTTGPLWRLQVESLRCRLLPLSCGVGCPFARYLQVRWWWGAKGAGQAGEGAGGWVGSGGEGVARLGRAGLSSAVPVPRVRCTHEDPVGASAPEGGALPPCHRQPAAAC